LRACEAVVFRIPGSLRSAIVVFRPRGVGLSPDDCRRLGARPWGDGGWGPMVSDEEQKRAREAREARARRKWRARRRS